MHRRRRLTLTLSSLVLVTILAACGAGARTSSASRRVPAVADNVHANGIPAFYNPPSPLAPAPHGTLIRAEKVTGVPGVPAGAKVWRILYHSETASGADVAVSGYVVAPPTTAPSGGYPVLAWAHGTTGFSRICAPSLFTDQGFGGIYLVPDLADYLRAGFLVAATDYQGLGAPGVSPYLVGTSEGRNVLDAALAAGQLPGVHAGRQLVVYGHSQGGQSALFAGQLAPSYVPRFHLAGVAAAAPATGLTTILSVARADAAALIFSYPTAYLWSRVYPQLPASDLLTTAAEQAAPSVVTTGCLRQVAQAMASRHLTPKSVFVPGFASNPVVVRYAKANNPGGVRTRAPLLIVQGTADTTVPPILTDAFVANAACPIGDTVDYLHVTGATHGTVPLVSAPTIVHWLEQRLHHQPPPSTCGLAGDARTLNPAAP